MSDSPIRVLQVLPNLKSGGVEQGTLDLSEFLVRSGMKSYVCSNGGAKVDVLKQHGAEHIQLPVHSKNPWTIYQNSKELVDLIHHLNIDVVHARSRAPAWSAYLACKKTKTPFVTTFHGTYNFKSPFKKLYNSVMVRGDRVIAISDFIKKHIHHHYKRYLKETTKVSVIHRGIDTDYFDLDKVSFEQRNEIRDQLGIGSNQRVVLLPGRLTRWKGQIILIEAMKYLEHHNVVALLVGSDQGRTGYKKELLKRIRTLGLREKVRILEDKYPMPLLYDLADIVVHTSTDPEAFGRVIAEAQAMGKPVITNDLGAPKEIILRNETGWLVPPKNPQKLAGKIKFVLGFQTNQLDEIAFKARERVLSSFSKDQMCSKVLSLYEDVLNR